MGHMNLSLPDELLDELRRAVPPRQRSAFVVEAIRQRLALVAQVDAVCESAGSWSGRGRRDPAKQLRAQREAWSKRGSTGKQKRRR